MGLYLHQSQSLHQECVLSQKQELAQYQKMLQTRLLKLEQRLVDPEFPDAIKWLEWIQKADELLKKKWKAGILIWGILKELCKETSGKERFQQHKDVDVLLLHGGNGIKPFEWWIDRWKPKKQRKRISTASWFLEKDITRWENDNGVKLCFGIDTHERFKDQVGLIIPDMYFYRTMKVNEAINVLSSAKWFEDIEIPEITLKKFEDVLLKWCKHNANMEIRKRYLSWPIIAGEQKQLIGKKDLFYHDPEVIRAFYSEDDLGTFVDKISEDLSTAMETKWIEKRNNK